MSTFILRQLDPDFWQRVRAKAAAEGITVKALILKLLAAWLAAAIVLSATPARADDKPLLLSMAAAHLMDITSTQVALRNPALVESNPLMRHPAGLYAVKGAVAAAQMVVVHRMWTTGHKRAAVITAVGLSTAYGLIGVHNLRVVGR